MSTVTDELIELASDRVGCALTAIDDARLNAVPRELLARFLIQAAAHERFARQLLEMKSRSIVIMR